MSDKLDLLVEIAGLSSSGTHEVALQLAKAGLVFFPCHKNKTPHIKEWQKLEAVDANQVQGWHKQWPDMMLGLPTGNNGLLVIDLDKAKDESEVDGLHEFRKDCAKHGYDFSTDTLCGQTPSGGLHVFYQMPASYKLRNTVRKYGKTPEGKTIAIDTRGHGGYVILAPSLGDNGKYEWLNQNPIAELPDWLLALLTTDKTPKASKPLAKVTSTYGAYANERERKAYQGALEAECNNVAVATKGIRNETLNVASYNLGRYVGAGKLDETEVYNSLYAAAQCCGLAGNEISGTITSGLSRGRQEPKVIEPYGGSWESRKTTPTSEIREGNEPIQEHIPTNLDEYLAETNAKRLIDNFMKEAEEFARSSAIPTGYLTLDALLDGGLYPGLYVLGAISSLGKTTFALQMADAIAQAGYDVLIFTLEMSKHELIAKTLSRISCMQAEQKSWPREQMRAARYYLAGKWHTPEATGEDSEHVYKALDIYTQWADRIHIIEGDYTLGALGLVAATKSHLKLTGNKPVVIVDYLQILAPLNDHYTDKQNTDRSIVALKRLSRDLKLPVVVVSSFNRDSYDGAITLKAFKESGAIEYTADVVIGMQLEGQETKGFDIKAALNHDPREIELLVLKNRHGQRGNANFKYYPKFNRFISSPTFP